MIRFVRPHLRIANVLELRPEHLRALGLDGLLLDVDGTLKDFPAPEFSAEVIAWVEAMRAAGIALCLVSNGRPRRLGALAGRLGLPCVSKALKPLPFGCRAALRKLGLGPKRVGIVGDQVFADVMAGRLAGVFTVLVPPSSPVEPWFTRLKRPAERLVLRVLRCPGLDEVLAAAPAPSN